MYWRGLEKLPLALLSLRGLEKPPLALMSLIRFLPSFCPILGYATPLPLPVWRERPVRLVRPPRELPAPTRRVVSTCGESRPPACWQLVFRASS